MKNADLLTIGMATRNEAEDLWFVLTSLTANHPRVSYVVVDNSPEFSNRASSITRASGGTYIHRPDLSGTSAPRAEVFRRSKTPWTACIDAHVILEGGAVEAMLRYAREHPDSRDIVQGPMIMDDGRGYADHWNQPTPPGLWGEWRSDPRGSPYDFIPHPSGVQARPVLAEGEQPWERFLADMKVATDHPLWRPFEIQMLGLGLWFMRTEVWPGFNRWFRGFGGEEGYLHERVRRAGGKALLHPGVRWRHKFRDYTKPMPYVSNISDHVWNLLIGHRELGLDAEAAIYEHFGKRLDPNEWKSLLEATRTVQPFGKPADPVPRKKLLAVWYSDNTAPAQLLAASAKTVAAAARDSRRHDVTVSAVSWEPVNGFDAGQWAEFKGEKRRGYDTILKQVAQAVEAAGGLDQFDAVCMCEHDVLYPPNQFDKIGDVLSDHPGAPVVANMNYIGLNATGWQWVKERHQPLHQLAVRREKFRENFARAEREAAAGGAIILEPDHDMPRSNWALIPPEIGDVQMPAVHVNHEGTAGGRRLSGHGDVCYFPTGWTLTHPFWGNADTFWPHGKTTLAASGPGPAPPHPMRLLGQQEPVAAPAPTAPVEPGCKGCPPGASAGTPLKVVNLNDVLADAEATPSDFNGHVAILKKFAENCTSAAEISLWHKPADVAMVAGLPGDGVFYSYCPRPKPRWGMFRAWMGDRFRPVVRDAHGPDTAVEPVDLLFLDTHHTAVALTDLLRNHADRAKKYIAVHCVEEYGEQGDTAGPDGNPLPGVLVAIREFVAVRQEWTVVHFDRSNHGLMILSRLPEDRKDLPSLGKMLWNYGLAKTRHIAAGRPVTPEAEYKRRLELCLLCPERNMDSCSACGCPLQDKLAWASERCGLEKKGLAPKWDRCDG